MSQALLGSRGPLPGDLPDSAGDHHNLGQHRDDHSDVCPDDSQQHPGGPGLRGGDLELQPGRGVWELQQPGGGGDSPGLRPCLLASALRNAPHRTHRRQHGRLHRHHNLREPPRHRELRRGPTDQAAN